MVKFFMPEAKNAKHKKKTDYRIIIFNKLLGLTKIKHFQSISKVIRAIKQAQSQSRKQQKDPQQALLKTKKLQQQQKNLQNLKQIKKRQMKLITLYIMVKQVKITNIKILEKLSDINKECDEIIKQVEENDNFRAFVQKVTKTNAYKENIGQIQQIRQGISDKKIMTKEKNKERKAKKLLQRQFQRQMKNQKFQQLNQDQGQPELKQQDDQQHISSQQKMGQKLHKLQKQSVSITKSANNNAQLQTHELQQKQEKQKRVNFWNKVNKQPTQSKIQKNQEILEKNNKYDLKKQNKLQPQDQQSSKAQRISFWNKVNSKAVVKQDKIQLPEANKNKSHYQSKKQDKKHEGQRMPKRTQFIKKGRNKAIQEKTFKKQEKYNKYKNKEQNNKQKNIRPSQRVNPKADPYIHPSWAAKMQQNNQSGIAKFQGKKILL